MNTHLTAEQEERLKSIANLVAKWRIDDWVLKHYSVYGLNNRDKPAIELWLQTVTEGARLAEDVRRGRIMKALDEDLVDLFGWVCAFVGKYLHQANFDKDDPIGEALRTPTGMPGPETLSKWILQKYPGVCPACGCAPCICSSHRGAFENRKEGGHHAPGGQRAIYEKLRKERVEEGKKLYRAAWKKYADSESDREAFYSLTLDELIDSFIFIYGGGLEGLDLWQIAAHLLEEIGEVGEEVAFLTEMKSLKQLVADAKRNGGFQEVVNKAYRREGSPPELKGELEKLKAGAENEIVERLRNASIKTLKEELADVFSWLCAVLYRMGDIMREVREEEEMWYPFKDRLENKNFNDEGAFVCFACKESPCASDCRAVWHVRKLLRDKRQKAQTAA